MNRGLDFEKAQAALKRAAEKAIHLTREERSGRFLPPQQAPEIAEPGKQPKLDNS